MLILSLSQALRARDKAGISDSNVCFNYDAFQRLNEWSPAADCSREQPMDPSWDHLSFTVPFAFYQRSSHSPGWEEDKRWKVMMLQKPVNSGRRSETYIYDAFLHSWIVPQLTIQPPLLSSPAFTTWCHTNIVLFGGFRFPTETSNETWIFNGVTETWHVHDVALWKKDYFVPARYGHTAVTVRQPLSNCTCQESILVFGGTSKKNLTCFEDLWEMRCIVDSSGRNVLYWIPLLRQDDHTEWPQARRYHTAVDYNKTVMYMWGGNDCTNSYGPFVANIWEYNLTSKIWKRFLGETNTNAFTTWGRKVFFVEGLDRIVALTDKRIYVLDFSNGSLHFESKNRLDQYDHYDKWAWAVAGKSALTLGFPRGSPHLIVWNVTYGTETADWEWALITEEVHSPLKSRIVSTQFVQDSLYVFSDSLRHKDNLISVWQFDLQLHVWFPTASPFTSDIHFAPLATTINKSMIVWYNVDPLSVPVTTRRNIGSKSSCLWIYHTTIRRWTLCLEISHQHELPKSRRHCTMVDMGNGSLLMFGGMTDEGVVNELWRVDVCDQEEYVPVKEECVRWVLLSRNGSRIISPSPRYLHASFVFSGNLFVFGGITETMNSGRGVHSNIKEFVSDNSTDMWQFRSNEGTWTVVRAKGVTLALSCLWTLAQWGKKVVLVLKPYCLQPVSHHIVVFDLLTETWSKLSDAPLHNPLAVTFLEGKLIVAGMSSIGPLNHMYIVNSIEFSFLNPACPSGHCSTNWKNESCKECLKGSYATVGATHCSSCPDGLTTNGSMAALLSDCVCRKDYCSRGTCTVYDREDQPRSAVCQCMAGYTGTTCNNPSYYLIGFVTGILLAVTLVLFLFVKKMVKHRRGRRDLEKELMSAYRVWNIDIDEIRLGDRIDGDTPGSYGEVYRATYRDIAVAVKHLSAVMLSDKTIKKEFEREVEVMRAIRHPNIVMFFGVGTVERQEGRRTFSIPFMVIELMSRGSLKNVLDSKHILLSYRDRVGFALGAARGMKYLHSLSPPRIHRDMKSANLLVSHSWDIKVSDFGSARVVRSEGKRQPTNLSRSQHQGENADAPLLKADSLLTKDTGTILWRAPEIFALGSYGTSADVYSFGIVLWELLCRKTPYEDYEFLWIRDVSRAVQGGTRPTIPQFAPAVYVHLMKQCWQTNPDSRPTFAHVVERLVAMASGSLVSTVCRGETETQL